MAHNRLALAALVAFPRPARAEEKAARLAAFDVLVRQGKPAKLRARLEGKGMLGVYSAVEGESVDFWEVAEPVAGGVITFTVNPASSGASATLSSATATIGPDGVAEVTAAATLLFLRGVQPPL